MYNLFFVIIIGLNSWNFILMKSVIDSLLNFLVYIKFRYYICECKYVTIYN